MSIKLITCSSELCSAHGNKTICFKVFSEESRTWQSHLRDQKIKKRRKRDNPTNQALPMKSKTKKKRNLSSKQKRSQVLISRFYHGSDAGSIPDIPTSSGSPLSSWLIYLPVGCARSFRIINVFINLLSIVARCTYSARCRGWRVPRQRRAITHGRTPGSPVVEMPHTYNQSVAFTSLISVLRSWLWNHVAITSSTQLYII